MRILPLKKGYAAFDIYKLIAQRPSKVHMTNSDKTMPRIFTFLSICWYPKHQHQEIQHNILLNSKKGSVNLIYIGICYA